MRFISISLGDWRRVRFCHDIWCGELLLHVRFPELFSIAVDREVLVELSGLFERWGFLKFDVCE